MRKHGFWRRALIVLSAIWIVIGGSFGWNHAYDDVDVKFKQCVTANPADLPACRDARNKALAVPRGVAAAIVAFGPLLVLWLATYGLVLLFRRMRRGSRSRTPLESEPGAH
ncbi:MAG: hypothetical protein AB7V40_04320 [Methyloceanibacter sp.]